MRGGRGGCGSSRDVGDAGEGAGAVKGTELRREL